MNKPKYLKDSIAKVDGYFSPKGEKLKSVRLTQEQIDAWNGTAVKKAKPVKKEEPVVEEEVVVEEVVEESAE